MLVTVRSGIINLEYSPTRSKYCIPEKYSLFLLTASAFPGSKSIETKTQLEGGRVSEIINKLRFGIEFFFRKKFED